MSNKGSDLGESPLIEVPVIERQIDNPLVHENNVSSNSPEPNNINSGRGRKRKTSLISELIPKTSSFENKKKETFNRPSTPNPSTTNFNNKSNAQVVEKINDNDFNGDAFSYQNNFSQIDNVPEMTFGGDPNMDSEFIKEENTTNKELPKESFGKSVNATADMIVSLLEKAVPEGASLFSQLNEDEAYSLQKEGKIVDGSYEEIVERNKEQKKDYVIPKDDADKIRETLSELLNAKGAELSPEARLVMLLLIVLIPIGWAAWQNKKRNRTFLNELLEKTKGEINAFKKNLDDEFSLARQEFERDIAVMKQQLDAQKNETIRMMKKLEAEKAQFEAIKNSYNNNGKVDNGIEEPEVEEVEEVK